jgi:hypothetical protein
MATTDARLAAAVLDGLATAGIEFAVLHNEETIAAGEVHSDLDVIVATKPRTAIRDLAPYLEQVGLRPIVLWDYDVSETLTAFLVTPDASEGVQLDLMFDPMGQGKYGARTGRMLERRVAGVRWPTASPIDRLAYLIRKRHVKRDSLRLNTLLTQARLFPAAELQGVIHETFSPRIATGLVSMANGATPKQASAYPLGYRLRDLARRVKRLRNPAGFWVEIAGDPPLELLDSIAERFGRILPVAGAGLRPRWLVSRFGWLLTVLAPVRWRAGLYVSGGTGWPSSDLRLPPNHDLDTLCSQIVEAMHARIVG